MIIPDFKQDDKAGLPKRNDEFAPSRSSLATPASVRGKGKNTEATIHRGDEAGRNRLIGKLRPQFALDEEVLQALDIPFESPRLPRRPVGLSQADSAT